MVQLFWNGGDDGTRTRGLCRDSTESYGNGLKLGGTDGLPQPPKVTLGNSYWTRNGPYAALYFPCWPPRWQVQEQRRDSLFVKYDSAQGIQLLQKIEVSKIACQNGARMFSGTCEQKRVIQDATVVVLSIAL